MSKDTADTALILRTCAADMTSWGGFVWPREGLVEAPDWSPIPECGGGLHGLLWGEGDGSLLSFDDDAVWIVAQVDARNVIDLGGKEKFPKATVVYAGDRKSATDIILKARPGAACVGAFIAGGDHATVTGGDDATVTGGYGATVTGGDGATVTGGNFATVTGGNFATVTGGDGATVTGGYHATVTGGDFATVTGGYGATVTGGNFAVLKLSYWDNRKRIVTAYVGEDGMKRDTSYRLVDGKFMEAE